MATEPMAHHKRVLSRGEVSSAKRPNQQSSEPFPKATALEPTSIYITITRALIKGELEILKAYSTLRDANWALDAYRHYEADDHPNGWIQSRDENGFLAFEAYDEDAGDMFQLYIEKIEFMPEGLVQPPSPSPPESFGGDFPREEGIHDLEERSSDEADEEGEEEDSPHIRSIKEEQRRGGRPKNCRGCGCGAALCNSCFPQTEEDWADMGDMYH